MYSIVYSCLQFRVFKRQVENPCEPRVGKQVQKAFGKLLRYVCVFIRDCHSLLDDGFVYRNDGFDGNWNVMHCLMLLWCCAALSSLNSDIALDVFTSSWYSDLGRDSMKRKELILHPLVSVYWSDITKSALVSGHDELKRLQTIRVTLLSVVLSI